MRSGSFGIGLAASFFVAASGIGEGARPAAAQDPPATARPSEAKPASDLAAPPREIPEEIRVMSAPPPGREGEEGPNMLNDVMVSMLAKIALEADKDERLPRFEDRKTAEGLLVTCNEIANHYSFEIFGKEIVEVQEEGVEPKTTWIVDAKRFGVISVPLGDEGPADVETLVARFAEFQETDEGTMVFGRRIAFRLDDGRPAVFYETSPKPDVAKNTDTAVALFVTTIVDKVAHSYTIGLRKGEDKAPSERLLRRVANSFRRLPDLPTSRAALTVDYLQNRGITLKQAFFINEALTGERTGALLENRKASRQDRKLERTRLLGSNALVRAARFHLLTHQGDVDLASDEELGIEPNDEDRRANFMGPPLQATVYDDLTAHSIVLQQYDRKLGGYVYWDPWPASKRSFLSPGNNQAGVAARRHPAHSRFYWITEEELVRVVYSISDRWDDLEQDRTLMEMLERPGDRILAELRRLHSEDRGQPHGRMRSGRLLGAGAFYLMEGRPEVAEGAFRACREFHPDAVEATIGLAEALRLRGEAATAGELYLKSLGSLAKGIGREGDDRKRAAKNARLVDQVRRGIDSLGAGARPVVLAPSPPERGDDPLYAELSDARLEKGQLDALLLLDELAIGREPENARLLDARGVHHRARGDFPLAIADHRRAIAIAPANPWSHLLLGMALGEQREFDAAIAELGRAIELRPDLALAYRLRGLNQRDKGAHREALADLGRAIEADPKDPSIHLVRGQLREKLGDLDGAIADANRAVELAPGWARAYYRRAEFRRVRKELDLALEDLARSIQLQKDPDAYQLRGEIFAKRGDLSDAIGEYSEALRHDPDDPAALLIARAWLYRRVGDRPKALSDLGQVIDRNPRHARAFEDRGEIRASTGDFGSAIEDFTRAIEIRPKSPWSYLGRASAHQADGDLAAARRDYDDAVRVAPELANAQNNRAWFLATCPDPAHRDGKSAVVSATRACELAGWKDAGYLDTLAAALAEVGEFDRAADRQARALELLEQDSADRQGMQERLTLYRDRKPYREPSRTAK